jgi:hypothetical protein
VKRTHKNSIKRPNLQIMGWPMKNGSPMKDDPRRMTLKSPLGRSWKESYTQKMKTNIAMKVWELINLKRRPDK